MVPCRRMQELAGDKASMMKFIKVSAWHGVISASPSDESISEDGL